MENERTHDSDLATKPAAHRVSQLRLPVIGQTAEDDPLALLRGGTFARWFALGLAVVGLIWIGGHKVNARDAADAVIVHPQLVEMVQPSLVAMAGAPAGNEFAVAPESAVPPPAEVEEIQRGSADEDAAFDAGFGRKRTAEGSLVLESEEQPRREGLAPDALEQLKSGGFFDPNAFADARTVKTKAYVHLMPGIPNEVFFGASVVILLLSFLVFERRAERSKRNPNREYWHFELTRAAWLRRFIHHRWFQPAVQIPVVILFLAVIVAGLVGSQQPGRNIAPVLTWNIWWIGLIFAVLLFGNLWCFMCPWTAIPDWIMRRSFTKVRRVASLARKYPRFRLWMWPAIVLFAAVTWLEIAYDAANRPWMTSMMGIGMVALAWALLLIYERKAMCRYVCFVGRVSGQYAMMGMLELRRRDNEVCRSCSTKDCFHGHADRGYACPTHEFMGAMNENQYCTLCTECVKSCPHDNIALRIRSWGADVLHPYRAKRDEAYMALLVFIVSAFHGAAMVPLWMTVENRVREILIAFQREWFGDDWLGLAGSHGGTLTFTLLMVACIVLPGVAFWLLCAGMRVASGSKALTTRKLFVRFAYTLLPIALFYHLAHNATHVFYEWSKMRRLVSDPLGWNTDFFGTARAPLSALWSPESIWYLQVGLIIVGHVYGIVVAQRETSRLTSGDRRAGLRVHSVMMVGMAVMSLISLWLLAQPMYMRTADM